MNTMTLDDYKNNEMNTFYQFLSESNIQIKDEIKEAIKQKNTLNQHIFDVFASRGVIGYGKINETVKKMLSNIENVPRRLLLNKNSTDVIIERNKFFIVEDGTKIEIEPMYMAYYSDLIDERALPIVIVPKDIYGNFSIKKEHQIDGKMLDDFMMNDVVKEALKKGASDIHFKYGKDVYNVSFKIHGALQRQHQFTMNIEKADDFFNKVRQKMANDTNTGFKASEYNLPQGGTLKYDELGVDLRGQFTPSGKMDKNNLFVVRIIKKNIHSSSLMTIDDLAGYSDEFIDLLKRATRYTKGLILVTGVTNSGKSTLTSSFINTIPEERSIATAEDPIEYDKSRWNATQHQVFLSDDKSISVGFLKYIKSWKRSDQDVIEIGEIRKDDDGSNELMEAVVEGVKAGNLTISTTHIDSAFDVPLSLVSIYGVDRYVVADLLVFVITQVLVEKLCPYCKKEDTEYNNIAMLKDFLKRGDVRFAWKKDLEEFIENKPLSYKRNPNGCPHCNHTGISGLTPVYEYYKPDVPMIMWLNQNLDHINRFDIEKEFCSKENKYLAQNKLTCYIEKLRAGEVDADIEVLTRVLQ